MILGEYTYIFDQMQFLKWVFEVIVLTYLCWKPCFYALHILISLILMFTRTWLRDLKSADCRLILRSY